MAPAYQRSWRAKGIIASILLSVVVPDSAVGFAEIYELEHNRRRLLVAVIYDPNEDMPLERAIANQTANFVSDVYKSRGTVSAARRDYDFTGRRALISVVDAEAVDLKNERLAQIFTADKVIGSIELVYTTSARLSDLPLIKRIRRWASRADLTNAASSLQAAAESAVVAEIKKFAVRKKPENRLVGALLAFLAVTLGMKRHDADVFLFPHAAQVETVVAETKTGAHVLTYRSLGMEEVYRFEHDQDFSDGRGLSLLRGVPAQIMEQTLSGLKRRHSYPPELRELDLGLPISEVLHINNLLNQRCSGVETILQQKNQNWNGLHQTFGR